MCLVPAISLYVQNDSKQFLGSVIVASDFDAQMSGIKFWKGDDNQRPVNKNWFAKFQWLLEFWTF